MIDRIGCGLTAHWLKSMLKILKLDVPEIRQGIVQHRGGEDDLFDGGRRQGTLVLAVQDIFECEVNDMDRRSDRARCSIGSPLRDRS